MYFICVSGRECGTPHLLCVGDGPGTAFKGVKQCVPMCPDPSTSPEESRGSLIPRAERQHNKSSSPGAQRCSQRKAFRLRL